MGYAQGELDQLCLAEIRFKSGEERFGYAVRPLPRGNRVFDDELVPFVEFAIAAWERPSRIPDALFTRLNEYFSEAQLVELTLRITLCGFFNKFNDALGIEEEPEAVERLVAISASSE